MEIVLDKLSSVEICNHPAPLKQCHTMEFVNQMKLILTLIGKKSLKWFHTLQFLTNLDPRPPDGYIINLTGTVSVHFC